MNGNTTDFARVVTGFLTDYLPLQRGYSKNTILSYRDALKLFIVFLYCSTLTPPDLSNEGWIG